MVVISGTDEAGRGPVLGPLVMAGVSIDEKDERKLAELGVKDSKLLTKEQREEMFDQIKEIAKDHVILVVDAPEIDDALRDPSTNLNWLEADTTIKILDYLKPDKAILDCPSTNPKAYVVYLKEKAKLDMDIVAEHKADQNYPVCSAASILAKVTRDRAIEKIKQDIGLDTGSGYPADPKTKAFLEENWDKFPEIFRQTWASYKNVAKMKSQKSLGDY